MNNSQESLKKINELRTKFLQEGKNLVWHGMYKEKFDKLVENDFNMQAYTTQRYWEDGKLRKDNAPDYNTSFWYHGWSISRSKAVSAAFGEILWAMDLNEIKKEFKTIPISWNFTIRNLKNQDHKREQEEFVIAHKGKYSLDFIGKATVEYQDRIDDIYDILHSGNISEKEKEALIKERDEKEAFFDKNWFKEIMSGPKGKSMDMQKISPGFFIVNKSQDSNSLLELQSHPLCLGVLDLAEINLDEAERIKQVHANLNKPSSKP